MCYVTTINLPDIYDEADIYIFLHYKREEHETQINGTCA